MVRAAAVAADLRERLDTFTRAAKRVQALRATTADDAVSPDPEAVHDLRVAARRLAAALDLWRPVLRAKPAKRAMRRLRRIRRGFGSVRDVEVHVEALAARRRTMPACADAIDEALDDLLKRRDERRKATRELLGPEAIAKLARRVERALASLGDPGAPEAGASPNGPPAAAGPRLDDADVRAVARRRARVVRAGRAAIAAALAAGYADAERHHDARIAIKRWRYAEESWAAALGAESRRGRRLRALQRALGVAQDAVTLRRLLEGIAGAEPLGRRLARERRRALDHFRTLATDLAATPRRRGDAAVSGRTPASPAAARGRGSSPGK